METTYLQKIWVLYLGPQLRLWNKKIPKEIGSSLGQLIALEEEFQENKNIGSLDSQWTYNLERGFKMKWELVGGFGHFIKKQANYRFPLNAKHAMSVDFYGKIVQNLRKVLNMKDDVV